MEQIHTASEGFNIRLESRLKNAELVKAREKLKLSAKETQEKICNFYRERGAFIYEEDTFPESLRQLKPLGKFVHETRIPEEKLIALSANLEQKLLSEDATPDMELM